MKGRRLAVCGWWLVATALAAVLVGCSTTKEEDERGTKVLMIGNSFSICLLQHLPQVASAAGVELDLASLYIGGCSLSNHWENAERDGEKGFKPYLFGRNRFGKMSQGKANVCDVLRMVKWDVVTVQQASHESWKPESYEPYGTQLIAKIRELAPQAKIYVQETWSYTPWDKRLQEWKISPDEMYERLHGAYGEFANRHGLSVIPFGTAVQMWRQRLPVEYTEKSFGGDVVGGGRQDVKDQFRRNATGDWVPNCDVFHLGPKGEYFQALVWIVSLLGTDVTDLSYCPADVSESESKLMREIAQEFHR